MRRSRLLPLPGAAAIVCTCVLLLASCGGGGGGSAAPAGSPAPAAPTTTAAPNPYVTFIATAKPTVTTVGIYATPQSPTPAQQLPNPWLVDPQVPTSKVAQVFLVQSQQDGWVQVLLPVRPNGSTGWVKASDVDITQNTFQIVVALGAHTITVTNRGQPIYQGPVAVGATNPPLPDAGKPTPTPTGTYYLRVLIQAPDPTTVYGPYAYGLSSHSDALDTFEGGDAEIGIHGNNDPSVLGHDATHGCVRMDNAAITMLAKQLPLGTPVDIVA